MNNFSPLPAAANDSRLSTPEAKAPGVSAELQARRQKLRRVVTWVVGGATALMCVGLISGAVRSHYRNVALAEASAESAQALAAAPTPEPVPSVPAAVAPPADTTAVTVASPASTGAPLPPKPAKKLAITHAKAKHTAPKSPLAHR